MASPERRSDPLAACTIPSGGTRLLMVALAVLLAACTPSPPPRPNVILVVLDAVRPDRLGCYGSDRGLTPFLDSLAERSIVFHRSYTAAPFTVASIASLLTSRWPSQHGIESFARVLAESEVTLPEVLHEHGYATGAFTANPLFRGFQQGFDETKIMLRSHADGVWNAAKRWLDARGSQPVFLYLHLMEGHYPYEEVPPDLDWRRRREKRPDPAHANLTYFIGSHVQASPDDRAEVEDAYDGGIFLLDRRLRETFAGLRELGLLDNAVIVVTADHGEELGDHGTIGHGLALFETSTRVPLLLHLPGQAQRVDVDEVVSLTDLAPTLLDAVGLSSPSSFEGRPLRRAIASADGRWSLRRLWWTIWPPQGSDARAAYSQIDRTDGDKVMHTAALVSGDGKVIVTVDGTRLYYDVKQDPDEQHPGALDGDGRARLDRAIAAVAKRAVRTTPAEVRSLDEGTRKHLEALGYVGE
jgi:arylsulfatase A-like enzyme